MKMIASYGLLEIITVKNGDYIVMYCGNMGTELKTVKNCFRKLYGDAAWNAVMPTAEIIDDDLSYMWSRKIRKDIFELHCKR